MPYCSDLCKLAIFSVMQYNVNKKLSVVQPCISLSSILFECLPQTSSLVITVLLFTSLWSRGQCLLHCIRNGWLLGYLIAQIYNSLIVSYIIFKFIFFTFMQHNVMKKLSAFQSLYPFGKKVAHFFDIRT